MAGKLPMRKKRNLKKGNNTKVALIFVGFVIGIVFLSLAFKFIVIVSQSKFDSSKRFTITVSSNKDVKVVSFSPDLGSISIVKLGKVNTPANKFLAIPIDGFIWIDSWDLDQRLDSLLPKMIFSYKKLDTNLTIVDLVKLFIFTKSLNDREIEERFVSEDMSEIEIDNLVGRFFRDDLIEKEGKKIQIINSTDVSGLGNRLARLVTNMGGDVILVATGDSPQKSSEITYIEDKNYTVERLSKILGFNTVETTQRTIADIIITIGEDSLNSVSF